MTIRLKTGLEISHPVSVSSLDGVEGLFGREGAHESSPNAFEKSAPACDCKGTPLAPWVLETKKQSGRSFDQMVADGEKAKKEGKTHKIWVTSGDSKVRSHHRHVGTKPIPIDMPFRVDGEDLMYPRDPAGSPRNTYNCRCEVEFFPKRVMSCAMLQAEFKANMRAEKRILRELEILQMEIERAQKEAAGKYIADSATGSVPDRVKIDSDRDKGPPPGSPPPVSRPKTGSSKPKPGPPTPHPIPPAPFPVPPTPYPRWRIGRLPVPLPTVKSRFRKLKRLSPLEKIKDALSVISDIHSTIEGLTTANKKLRERLKLKLRPLKLKGENLRDELDATYKQRAFLYAEIETIGNCYVPFEDPEA